MRAGIPAARASAIKSTVCSVQSPESVSSAVNEEPKPPLIFLSLIDVCTHSHSFFAARHEINFRLLRSLRLSRE